MQTQKYSIMQWAKDGRPREKLLSKGSSALSSSERAAILINHGAKEKNWCGVSREAVKAGKDNLNELCKFFLYRMNEDQGPRPKVASIVAAVELGRRRQAAAYRQKNDHEHKY